MGNGQKTPLGLIFGAIAVILVIISIVLSISADIDLLGMLF